MSKSAFGKAIAGGKGKADAPTKVSLADAMTRPALRDAITAATGAVATEQDVKDGADAIIGAVREMLRRYVLAACAAEGSRAPSAPKTVKVRPEDVYLSSKDGLKVYAYVLPQVDEATVTLGVSVRGVLGKAFATVARRGSED